MRVALTHKKDAAPELERLDGMIDDVWALCFRKPRPGWRLLGRFIERDTFIALRAYDRHHIGRLSQYIAAAYGVIEDWERLFGSIDPVRGTEIGHYLSGVWRDVNQAN